MSRAARVWLAERAGPVPPSLQSAMETAAGAVGTQHGARGESLARALADASLRSLRNALPHRDDRTAALDLLAADALLTFACEAAAESDAQLDHLAETFAPARLAELLPDDGQ